MEWFVLSMSAQTLSYHIPGEEIDISDLVAATTSVRLPEVTRPETILIMAGGLGQRMMPLTRDLPKPMLPIGDAPILEHILAQMISQGFCRFVFSVRHLSDQLMDHFGDGSRWGISIRYIVEPHRLGTGGSLAYLEPENDLPFIVANADLITDLDYRRVLASHSDGAVVTMCTRSVEFQVPYGVVDTECDRVRGVVEKPTQSVTISAGMYAVSPRLIGLIDKGEQIDMPDLIQRAIESGLEVRSLPISDRWVDVGRRTNYERVLENLGLKTAGLS